MSKEGLERLTQALEKLSTLSDKVDALFESYRRLTVECSSRIRAEGTKSVARYLKRWLRSFVGMKDECMVLISGEVIRRYHENGDHKKFLHDRGKENNIYKRSKVLSLCSADGIDYEYRQLVDKYGEKSALSRIADRNETLGSRLNVLSKKIDESSTLIKDVVQNLQPTQCQIDLLHPVEKVVVSFGDEIRISELGSKHRNCSQVEALSTIIEDSEESTTVGATGRGKKRPRNGFGFDSDEEEERSAKTVLVAPKVVDFHMDVSLDEIKRSTGASFELLANPSFREIIQAEEAEFGEEDPDDDILIIEDSPTTETAINIFTNSLPSSILPPPSFRTIKFKVIPQVSNITSPDVAVEKPVVVSITVAAYDSIYDSKEKAKLRPQLLAEELLQEITSYLWYGLVHYEAESNHSEAPEKRYRASIFRPWLPISLQVEGVKFLEDALIPLPAENTPKRYPVLCDSHPLVSKMMRGFHSWVEESTPKTDGYWHKQDLLVHNMRVIRQLSRELRSNQNSTSDNVVRMALPVFSVPLHAMEDYETLLQWRRLVHAATATCLQAISQDTSAAIWEFRDGVFHDGALFWLALQYGTSVCSTSSALLVLDEIMKPVDYFTEDLTVATAQTFVMETLILQDSVGLLSYLDDTSHRTHGLWASVLPFPSASTTNTPFNSINWKGVVQTVLQTLATSQDSGGGGSLREDPWIRFCVNLLKRAPKLTRLMLPRHVLSTGTPTAVLVLMVGILCAVQARSSAPAVTSINGDAVLTVCTIGLRRRFPDLYLTCEEMLHQLCATDSTVVVQLCDVDPSADTLRRTVDVALW